MMHYFTYYAILSIQTDLTFVLLMLPDPENMGIAVGILLLSCVQAEIYVFKV